MHQGAQGYSWDSAKKQQKQSRPQRASQGADTFPESIQGCRLDHSPGAAQSDFLHIATGKLNCQKMAQFMYPRRHHSRPDPLPGQYKQQKRRHKKCIGFYLQLIGHP